MNRLGRACRWMLFVTAWAAPVSAQNVALRGPAPVPPGLDAPTRPLSVTKRLRPPHETPESGTAVGTRRRIESSPADVRPAAGPPLPEQGQGKFQQRQVARLIAHIVQNTGHQAGLKDSALAPGRGINSLA